MNKKISFLSCMEEYFTCYLSTSKNSSPNTIKSYKYTFRLLIKFMNDINGIAASNILFSNLNYDTLNAFLNWLINTRKCSNRTRNQRLAALLSFSEYVQNKDYDAASVFRKDILKIPLNHTINKIKSSFTIEELKILLGLPNEKTKTGLRDKVLLCLLYATGARAQEICDLTVSSLDIGGGNKYINIIGKGNKIRKIKLSDNSANLIYSYIKHLGIEHLPKHHIFSSQTHEQMSISCVETILKKYVRLAKKNNPDLFTQSSYSPHSIRHSTATHMLELGIPLMIIKNFLGHSSIQTTQIYASYTQDTIDTKVLEWNNKWFKVDNNTENENNNKSIYPEFLNVK